MESTAPFAGVIHPALLFSWMKLLDNIFCFCFGHCYIARYGLCLCEGNFLNQAKICNSSVFTSIHCTPWRNRSRSLAVKKKIFNCRFWIVARLGMDHFLWAAATKSDTFSPFHTCAPRQWREKIGQEEIETCIGADIFGPGDFSKIKVGKVPLNFDLSRIKNPARL